jgi:hypothetical protein
VLRRKKVRARGIDRVACDDRLVVGEFAKACLAIQQRAQAEVGAYFEFLRRRPPSGTITGGTVALANDVLNRDLSGSPARDSPGDED